MGLLLPINGKRIVHLNLVVALAPGTARTETTCVSTVCTQIRVPESFTMCRSASGNALCRSQADFAGHTTSYRPCGRTMDGGSFLSFPYRYVCPEPVLVKMKTIVFKWRKKDVVLRTWTIEVGMWRILSTLSRIHVSHSKNPPCTK
jgi:hypothetical protein